MNLGSSKKWVELLRAGAHRLNDGFGLKWSDGSFSPVGVLEDFITKKWTNNAPHTGCYTNVDGNINTPSAECLKRVKAKGNLDAIDNQANWRTVDEICRFIEANYAEL